MSKELTKTPEISPGKHSSPGTSLTTSSYPRSHPTPLTSILRHLSQGKILNVKFLNKKCFYKGIDVLKKLRLRREITIIGS